MQSSGEERREFQRLRLEAPLPGSFGSTEVTIVEAGVLGARVQHLSALDGPRNDFLRAMLSLLVVKAIENHHDSSMTRLRVRKVDGDKTVRGVDAQFLSFRLDNGQWRRRHVFLPEQPAAGFTVARGEDAEEMQRLCTVYEASDDEGRRLIRLFAELSVSDALQIPPRS